ncbi:retrovirus-related Pol polyprotein from transposon 297 [Trichonephila clavipes]|nr:retrovirus-related Pol polyprotein from transposon 297 [Trichonephila clavipes]
MAELLNGLEDFVVPYLDDIAIFSDTWESHLKHGETVLQRIKKAKLTIKPSKCKFVQQNVKFLGHIVGQGFRTPSEVKVQAVLEFPTPRTKTQIRAFLGLAGYYQKYINLFSVIAAPLTDALKGREKRGEIKWTTECGNAFRELKGIRYRYSFKRYNPYKLLCITQLRTDTFKSFPVLTRLDKYKGFTTYVLYGEKGCGRLRYIDMQSEKDKKLYTPRRREETSGWTIDSWGGGNSSPWSSDRFEKLEEGLGLIDRGEACYRMVSLLKGSCPKNFIKRYFRELWFLSCGEKEDEYFLTDDHVPAFRAVVQLTAEEKIALGNVQRLTSENESDVQ